MTRPNPAVTHEGDLPPARPRLAAALAGAALALAHAGVTGAWWGPGQTPLWTAAALLIAAVVGAVAGARGPVALVVATLSVAAVAASVLGLAPLASASSLAPAAALVALGALAGDALGRAASAAGLRSVAVAALAGAALLLVATRLPGSRAPRPDALLGVIALCLVALAHRRAGALVRPLRWRGAGGAVVAAAVAGASVAPAIVGGPPASTDAAALRDDIAAGRARVRFDARGAQVVDVRDGDRTGRLLAVDGQVRAVLPLERDDRRLLAPPVLEAALVHLLAPEPPRRLLVVGLDAGVSAGVALLGSAVEAVQLLEPHPGVVAAHRDPGDLFGAVNGRPLADPRARLIEGPVWPALRARSPLDWDAVLAGACERPGDAEAARAVTDGVILVRVEPGPAGPDGEVTWPHLRSRLAALLPALGPDVLAFWPRPGAPLLLVAGAGPLAPARVAARWQASPALRARLEQLGLRRAADVLGLWVAGPTGLAAFAAQAGDGDDPYALARRAAESLPAALVLPAGKAERVAMLVALAEEAGARRAPSSAAFALAALREERTPETLRVLGDLLLQEGRHGEALARWREALALDPAAVAPKISMALLHQQRGEGDLARGTLERALEGDATKDAPLRYVLGQLAMAEGDYTQARAHFLAAGALSDAADRAVLAGELLRRGGVQPDRRLTPAQRVEAARLRVTRAEAALAEGEDAAAEREQAAAVAALLELSADPSSLTAAQRADVGRLLSRCASAEPLEPARAHLYRLAAEVLEPLDEDPALAVERAVALHLGGRTADAEAALLESLRGAGARLPRVHAALGDLLAATGRREAAIDAYEQALALGPGSSSDARLYLAIAWLEQELGRLDRAARALEAADRQAPDHPEVLANLGTVYRAQGRVGDALAAWRRFLAAVGPDHPMRARIAAAVRQLER